MAKYPQQLVDQARMRYLAGRSFREIADELLPTSSGGWVTIFRWSKQYHWKEEKEELERKAQEAVQEDFSGGLAMMAHRHLQLADKALLAVELALDEAFERDENGRIIAVRKDKYGKPILWGQSLVMLLEKASDMQRKALGVGEGIPRQDLERAASVAQVDEVHADPMLLKRFGDFLALEAGTPQSDGDALSTRPLESVESTSTTPVPEGPDLVSSVDNVLVTSHPSRLAQPLPVGREDEGGDTVLHGN